MTIIADVEAERFITLIQREKLIILNGDKISLKD